MHLAAGSHALDLACVKAIEQLGDARAHGLPPALWILLAPARLEEAGGIRFLYEPEDTALLVHKKEFGC